MTYLVTMLLLLNGLVSSVQGVGSASPLSPFSPDAHTLWPAADTVLLCDPGAALSEEAVLAVSCSERQAHVLALVDLTGHLFLTVSISSGLDHGGEARAGPGVAWPRPPPSSGPHRGGLRPHLQTLELEAWAGQCFHVPSRQYSLYDFPFSLKSKINIKPTLDRLHIHSRHSSSRNLNAVHF